VFAREASPVEKEAAAVDLHNALGRQASRLLEIMPSLASIMALSPSINANSSIYYVDSAKNMRFLCCSLLTILSNHLARRIIIWLDDLQWSDSASMLLIGSLLADTEVSKYVFFICSYRDDEIKDDVPFTSWLASISEQTLRRIHLTNLNEDVANTLISDALQLFPRLTRPLSSVLHHKTRGNPLFLTQLLASLREEGHLRLRLSPCRWTWDLDQIVDMKISDNVLELLMKEMGKVSSELQLGLKVASCMGSCVEKSTLYIISNDVGIDLNEVLEEVSKKGFMDDVGDRFRFCHDRIEQAAYDLMSFEERQTKHMQFGRSLCINTNCCDESDEMLFTALNQINRGGPLLLSDFNQRNTISSLNLRAGKRCIAISDVTSALSFYESGISFLNPKHWLDQYELSLELFEATISASCTLNDPHRTKQFSDSLLLHAKNYDDKLHTLLLLVRHRRVSMELHEAKRLAYEILEDLGEELPRPFGDPSLRADIHAMGYNIAVVSDEAMLGLERTNIPKVVFLMGLYNELLVVLQLLEPSFTPAVSLRMVQLTLVEGITDMSSLAFASFGPTLLAFGDPTHQGYRLGKLSLRLVDKMNATGCKANVNMLVQEFIAWVS
jgi:predicted ATPase